jgi:HD-GYP domain-containing protein (c-di-GMP phosphodiesterase class II)
MNTLNIYLLIGAIVVFLAVLEMVRRRNLREEYSLLWLIASGAYLVLALWPKAVLLIANLLGIAKPENVVLLVGVNLLLLILIQYSIRLSKLTNRYKDLTQQISIIDHEINITTRDLFRIQRSNKAYFYVLAASVGARDQYSNVDIERKVSLIQTLSHYLEWTKDEIESLEFAAILHDIGKINIPISALYKTSELSDEEWEMIKTHPLTSVSILEGIPFLLASIPIIRYHHECWDGSGYPEGLAGEEIPEGARILGLADTLVALTSNRPYREALSCREARAIVDGQSGKKFDPQIIEALHACWEKISIQLQPDRFSSLVSNTVNVMSDQELSALLRGEKVIELDQKREEDGHD